MTPQRGNAANSAVLESINVAAINPPGTPQLQPVTDSGISSSDGITNFNNSSPALALQFMVPNTSPGATIMIYADGTAIGSAVAPGSSTVVTTSGSLTLANGTHGITATQSLSGSQTAASPALSITIDTAGPVAAIFGPLSGVPASTFSGEYLHLPRGQAAPPPFFRLVA